MQLANGFYLNRFQSTLSMRRATCGLAISPRELLISIHALHEESDLMASPWSSNSLFQSTLSMRRATEAEPHVHHAVRFQSTLSMRRATMCREMRYALTKNFNPRSP